jgi:Family of unknown function (DUF5681)
MRRRREQSPAQPRIGRQRNEAPPTDYAVGFGRPPKHSQFRPGKSGNPRGRPKKRASLQDIVTAVLFEKMEVRVGERTHKIASVDALVRTAMNRALKGDHKFLMSVIAFIRMSGLCEMDANAAISGVDRNADEAILADFLKRHGFGTEATTPSVTETKEPSTKP